MKMLHLIQVNLKKVLTSGGFYACAVLTVILCFTAEIGMDPVKHEGLSVLQISRMKSREEMLSQVQYQYYNILRNGMGVWISIFIPIIAAFPFIPLVCDARESRSVRMTCIRLNKRTYDIGSFLSAMLSGGLAVLTGFLMFAGITAFLFPQASEYSPELRALMEENYPAVFPLFEKLGYPYLYALRFLEVFLYGAASAVPAFLLTAVMKNKYLILSIPFFIIYMLREIQAKLSEQVWRNWENPDLHLKRILTITGTNALDQLFTLQEDKLLTALYSLFVLAAGCMIYLAVMDRRLDYGE